MRFKGQVKTGNDNDNRFLFYNAENKCITHVTDNDKIIRVLMTFRAVIILFQ